MALDTSVDINLFMDNEGRPAAPRQILDVDTPAMGEVVGRVALGDRAIAFGILETANQVFPVWTHSSGDERSQLLIKADQNILTKANPCEKSWTIL